MLDHKEDIQMADSSDVVKTLCVSGIKDSSTDDAITLLFQNKRRSRGGELCPGERGFKRISRSVACLTFRFSKGIVDFLNFVIVAGPWLIANYVKIENERLIITGSITHKGPSNIFLTQNIDVKSVLFDSGKAARSSN